MSRFAAFLTIAATLLCAPASAAVPPDIAMRIQQAADNWRAGAVQQQEMLKVSGDPYMASVSDSMSRQISASMISQAVMDAIARNPRDARDATVAALRAAPELRNDILASLTTAFPGFASMLQSAGSRPAPSPVTAGPAVRTASVPAQPIARPASPASAPAQARMSEADQVAAEFADPMADRDPLEGFNRIMFGINDFLDTWILVPIATAYRFVMPETIREMGRSFFENLNEPVVAANDLLQGDISSAGVSLGRFAVNSTVGILGFFEVAERIDLKEHNADFGQTLHSYGTGSGPYLVLPFFGPSTVRDAIGKGVDSFLNPFNYVLDWETRLYMKASEIVVDREEVLDEVDQLKKGSIDYYAAVRSAWFQKRDVELNKGVPPPLGRQGR